MPHDVPADPRLPAGRALADAGPAGQTRHEIVRRKLARALLERAAHGDRRALTALRARLDLPGTHAGPAKSERATIIWRDWD
jgi:hypothetical protein